MSNDRDTTLWDNGDSSTFSQWVVATSGGYEPREHAAMGPKHDTYESALAEFESQKLKHQRSSVIIRLDITATAVHNGDHISFEDAFGWEVDADTESH